MYFIFSFMPSFLSHSCFSVLSHSCALLFSSLFILFPFTHFPSPYSVFFLHSVLVNNAVHITRLSFLLFSAPWLDNCDSPGPVRHQGQLIGQSQAMSALAKSSSSISRVLKTLSCLPLLRGWLSFLCCLWSKILHDICQRYVRLLIEADVPMTASARIIRKKKVSFFYNKSCNIKGFFFPHADTFREIPQKYGNIL